jgi:MCP family monocarboxylic acid transporter-like MFS transporter 10
MAFDAGYLCVICAFCALLLTQTRTLLSHHLMIGGSLVYCFSLFMVSLAEPGQYYQVYHCLLPKHVQLICELIQIFLAQGVGMGLGLAMTFLPILSVLAHHFSRRRAFAIGIMTSGKNYVQGSSTA